MKGFKRYFPAIVGALLSACATVPDGINPVGGFELERYLGLWHEIARLDHSFERGLIKVTAEYSLRADGGVRVLNRGFDPVKNVWKQAEGRAYFAGPRDTGSLKVSFFRPFYGGYNVIELDKGSYSYAMVAGLDRSYLWILARDPAPPAAVVEKLVARARELGFETDKLIFPK